MAEGLVHEGSYYRLIENDMLPIRQEDAPDPRSIHEELCKRKFADIDDSEPVVALRLFSDPSYKKEDNTIFGIKVPFRYGRHSFVMFENNSEKDVVVGKVILPPKRIVSLGVFSKMKTMEHGGLWYCLDGRNIVLYDYYKPRESLRCDITLKDLDIINSKIGQFFCRWEMIHNCSQFARYIWNLVTTPTLTRWPLCSPINLYKSMIKTGKTTLSYPVPFYYFAHYVDNMGKPQKSKLWNKELPLPKQQ